MTEGTPARTSAALQSVVLLLVLAGLPSSVGAQDPGIARLDTLTIGADSTVSLRPFVVVGTVQVTTREGVPVRFSLEAVPGKLRCAEGPVGGVVVVRYRYLPLDLRPVYRLDREPVIVEPERPRRRAPPAFQGTSDTGLRTRGSISRGVIAGSNQDVAIESGLRLEMDGELAPGVAVRASLTDADTPIRPDGSTQRLSEFDRVFIEMTAAPGQVVLGDFDARLQASRFAALDRKLQGVMVRSRDDGAVRVHAVGATSRGEFQSQDIRPIDGVQGPYRLQGQAGDSFALVLPGTENIYLDGRLLTRGESADYVMDYVTGEVTFTARNVISSDRRITAEFQFATNQFTRTLVAAEFDADIGRRLTLGGTVIREADTGEFLSEFGLTAEDSLLLAGSGDSAALRSGAQPVTYDPEARYVHYVLVDRGGQPVFQALNTSPDAGQTVYRVQFTRVGEGLGSYVRDAQSVNGIAYRFVGPGSGTYDPVRRLPSPALRAVVDLRASVRRAGPVRIDAEWARSVHDFNRLSPLDAADDDGTAFRVGIASDSIGGLGRGKLVAFGSLRGTTGFFSAFERFRDLEFAREWNVDPRLVPTTSAAGAEREQELGLHWSAGDSAQVGVSAAALELPGVFEATRLRGNLRLLPFWAPGVSGDFLLAESQAGPTRGRFDHGRLRLDDRVGLLELFAEVEGESRIDRLPDSLLFGSTRFLEIRPGWALERGAIGLSGYLEHRREELPAGSRLEHASRSWTVGGAAGLSGEQAEAEVQVAWRVRNAEEGFAGSGAGTDTRALILGTDGRASTGPWQFTWRYDARTERTPVLQEIFLRVGPELGGFVWVDLNSDEVVQLDELLPETTPNEGTYLRTFLPSDSLASVNTVHTRVIGRYRRPAGDTSRLRVNLQSLLEVEERSRTGRRTDVYLLRLSTFRTPGLTASGRLRLRQDVSLFDPGSGIRMDAAFQETRSLSELAAGVETRLGRLAESTLSFPVTDALDTSVRVAVDRSATDSERFASRRFDLVSRRIEPGLTVRGDPVTVRVSAEVARKTESVGDRSATLFRVPLSVRWARAGRSDVTGRLEVADIQVSGPPAVGLAGFELTDGRGAGRSALWGLSAQLFLTASLRATVAYDGRAPSEGRVIHTGRIQVSALF